MALNRERSKWELIRDVLLVLKHEHKPKKTRVMRRAYVDWRGFNIYFNMLIEGGFISECRKEGGWLLTDRGHELLKRLDHVNELISLNSFSAVPVGVKAQVLILGVSIGSSLLGLGLLSLGGDSLAIFSDPACCLF